MLIALNAVCLAASLFRCSLSLIFLHC